LHHETRDTAREATVPTLVAVEDDFPHWRVLSVLEIFQQPSVG
jgi:hypothetical protein